MLSAVDLTQRSAVLVRSVRLCLQDAGRERVLVYFAVCLDNWLFGTELLLLLSVEFRQYVYAKVRLTL